MDGTKEYLDKLNQQNIKPVHLDRNVGFALACNKGTEQAVGEYLLFIRHNMILPRSAINRFQSVFSQDNNIAAISPKIIDKYGRIIEAGKTELIGNQLVSMGEGFPEDEPQFNYKREMDGISAHSFIVKREDFFELGQFFEELNTRTMAFLDLGKRLLEAGKTIVYQPHSVIKLQDGIDNTTNQPRVPELKQCYSHNSQGISGKRILVLGIYLTDQKNQVKHISENLNDSKLYTVDQKWVALGKNGKHPGLRVDQTEIKQMRPKFCILNEILLNTNIEDYEYIILVDDDIFLPDHFIDNFISVQGKLKFSLAQPARTQDSFIDHNIVMCQDGLLARETYFVEIGPLVSIHRSAYQYIVPFDERSPMGWGYENVWAYRLTQNGLRMGIIDATPIDHSLRPPVANYSWEKSVEQKRQFLSVHHCYTDEQCMRVLETFRWEGDKPVQSSREYSNG